MKDHKRENETVLWFGKRQFRSNSNYDLVRMFQVEKVHLSVGCFIGRNIIKFVPNKIQSGFILIYCLFKIPYPFLTHFIENAEGRTFFAIYEILQHMKLCVQALFNALAVHLWAGQSHSGHLVLKLEMNSFWGAFICSVREYSQSLHL